MPFASVRPRIEFHVRANLLLVALFFFSTAFAPGFAPLGAFFIAHAHPALAERGRWSSPLSFVRPAGSRTAVPESSEQDAAKHQQPDRLPVTYDPYACERWQDGIPEPLHNSAEQQDSRYGKDGKDHIEFFAAHGFGAGMTIIHNQYNLR